MADAAQLRIRVLGELAATLDGTALDLGGPRQRAVLALLVLARGDSVPAEALVESVWGDAPPGNAAGALQSYVSHLRRRLEPGAAARTRSSVIVREGPGYAVRLPPDAVDAWRFESLLRRAAAADPARVTELLGEALRLWRGPALAEYVDEAWARPEITRLTELRAVAREQLLAARLALGESGLLVPELEAMVAEEPLREERWRLLVLALYRAQRQADALAALRRARATLADELGVDPGPALRQLEAAVLAQSPGLDLPRPREPAAAAPAQGGTTAPAVPPPPRPPDLVDRDRELAVLARALDDLAAGEPGLLLLEGPAGIGKSRLLTELRRLAGRQGLRVLAARGSPLESSFGLGVVRQLFEPALLDRQERERVLGGAAGRARGVFDVVDPDQPEGSFAVLHGLYWLTVNLAAAGPLVLAVDDLQWCDSGSLRYLAYLARRLEGLPLLVAGTVRTGEPRDDEDLLTELAVDATVLRLGPLSDDATATLVRGRLGDGAAPLFLHACHRTTSGNPLLLRQLLRALEAEGVRPDAAHADVVVAVGSRAVSSQVLLRLRRLPPEATEVARAVAVLGAAARLPAVAALAGLEEGRAAAALARLTRAEVLGDREPLGFVHPLVRDAVYHDLPAPERALWHERAAGLLRDRGDDPEQVAAHLLLAPHRGDPASVAVLRSAARRAADRGAADSAVTCLRRALEEPCPPEARVDVLLELGLVESLLDGPASTQHLLAAYEVLDDSPTRGEVALAIARTHVFASAPGTAAAFARAARQALPDDADDVRQGLLAVQRISCHMQLLDPRVWRAEPPPEPAGRGHGARMLAAALAWEAVCEGRNRHRAVALARSAVRDDRLFAVDPGLFWVVAAVSRMVADDDLGDFWHRARAEAHARGSLFTALSVNTWQGFWHWRRGELAEALACVRDAEEQDRMWGGSGVGVAYSRASLVGIHLDRGDLAAARAAADEATGDLGAGEGLRHLEQARVALLLAEGRHAEALAALDRDDPAVGTANPAWNPWRSLRAGALHGLGSTAEAVALLREEVALLRAWDAPSSLGHALIALGTTTGDSGPLREAVAVLEPTNAVLLKARARLALAGSPDVPDREAVPLLRAALAGAVACGALAVRDAARAGLASRGCLPLDEPPPPPAPSPTQRRIAELTAQGLDVREVAQALFLTPGTVRAALGSPTRLAEPGPASQVLLKSPAAPWSA